MATKTITTRAKAFQGYGVEKISCRVHEDGAVLVFDSVAGHYTSCHSLAPSAERRIRKLAGLSQQLHGRGHVDPRR